MALGCRDVARIDFRMDDKGRIYFIECNPLPGLTPGWSDLVLIAQGAGMDYRGLIGEIMARRHPPLQGARALGVLVGHTTIIRGRGPLQSARDRCAPGSRPSSPTREHLHGAARRRRLRPQRRGRGLGDDAGDGVGSARDAHPPHQHHVGGGGLRRGRDAWSSSTPASATSTTSSSRWWASATTAGSTTSPAATCARSTSRGDRHRGRRAGGRGERRRRHRHGDLRLQGRHRHERRASSPRCSAATRWACW